MWVAIGPTVSFVVSWLVPGVAIPTDQGRARAEAQARADAEAHKRFEAERTTLRALSDLDDRYNRGETLDADFMAERDALRATLPAPPPSPSPWLVLAGWIGALLVLLGAYLIAIALAGYVVVTIVGHHDVSRRVFVAIVAGAATLGLVASAVGWRLHLKDVTFLLLGVPVLVLVVVFGLIRP
jgi:hypothetical protein